MLAPLVVLAGLAAVGGIIQLPNVTWLPESITQRSSTGWSRSSSSARPTSPGTWGYGNKTILMLIASAAAVGGIILAWLVYEKDRVKAVEPTVLANAWYYDKTVSDFMGGPGREAFEGAAWFDANVIDGAVNGAGRVGARRRPVSCARARAATSAAYAGIIGIGVVLLLAWFVVVRGIL